MNEPERRPGTSRLSGRPLDDNGRIEFMPKTYKIVRAQVGEIVRIIWRDDDDRHFEEERTAPPVETWNAKTKLLKENEPKIP